jgi:HK97 family phage portal protein
MGLIDGAVQYIGGLFRKGGFYQTQFLGQKGAVWIDTQKPYELYNNIPQLKAVIDKKASMFSNMEIILQDKVTKERNDDSQLYDLIQNPNAMQSMNEFLRMQKTQEQVYGNQFVYKNHPSKLMKYPSALWNISPKYVRPVLSGKVFEQVSKEDIILSYEYTIDGSTKFFDTKDILFSRIIDLDDPIIGASPIRSLQKPLSNIDHAYSYRNVIMSEKGAIGMITNESKDGMGGIPLTDDERTRIEESYRNKYGVSEGQARIILTEASLKWQPMTYPTKDLMLFEEVDANMITIIDHFGLNLNLFSSKNATFENVKNAIIQTYQDTIQPEADQFIQALTKFLNIPPNLELVASYEYLSIMKENKQRGMAAVENIVRALTQSIQSGLITGEQAEVILAGELGLTNSEKDNNSRMLNGLNRLSPLVANNVLASLTPNEKRALVGAAAIEGGDELPQPEINQGF